MEENKFIDHNYFLDKNGYIFKIIGDFHDEDFVFGYVKYYPHKYGAKLLNGQKYMVNTDVFKSYFLLSNFKSKIRYSYKLGNCVTGCLKEDIIKIYDQREQIQRILKNKQIYERSTVGKKLLEILDFFSKNNVDLTKIGVTGSFLTDMYDEKSDIDLVCYGSQTRSQLKELFNNEIFEKYEGELFTQLYKRRSSHMPSLSPEILRIQESRKIQALYKGVHVNVLTHKEKLSTYNNIQSYVDMGDVSVIAKVKDDTNSIYGPAFYDIEKAEIIDGFKSLDVENRINLVISFISAYSQIIKKGEMLYAKGTLLRYVFNEQIYYAISIDPWNRGLDNKIQLIKK